MFPTDYPQDIVLSINQPENLSISEGHSTRSNVSDLETKLFSPIECPTSSKGKPWCRGLSMMMTRATKMMPSRMKEAELITEVGLQIP